MPKSGIPISYVFARSTVSDVTVPRGAIGLELKADFAGVAMTDRVPLTRATYLEGRSMT
ncbi:hypothetical protein [Caballeronia sordidicola]|uniref:hypothetical protein n=1 Tax=Caballeronia sordidicola TaxID=196367 RepID=UPI0015C65D6E|nr:hypothetical protein [Caballeronia sordidicola]